MAGTGCFGRVSRLSSAEIALQTDQLSALGPSKNPKEIQIEYGLKPHAGTMYVTPTQKSSCCTARPPVSPNIHSHWVLYSFASILHAGRTIHCTGSTCHKPLWVFGDFTLQVTVYPEPSVCQPEILSHRPVFDQTQTSKLTAPCTALC